MLFLSFNGQSMCYLIQSSVTYVSQCSCPLKIFVLSLWDSSVRSWVFLPPVYECFTSTCIHVYFNKVSMRTSLIKKCDLFLFLLEMTEWCKLFEAYVLKWEDCQMLKTADESALSLIDPFSLFLLSDWVHLVYHVYLYHFLSSIIDNNMLLLMERGSHCIQFAVIFHPQLRLCKLEAMKTSTHIYRSLLMTSYDTNGDAQSDETREKTACGR